MEEHYNTGPGYPQTKAEVDALPTPALHDFMARCGVEPADFDDCLACYAYWVVQNRESEVDPTGTLVVTLDHIRPKDMLPWLDMVRRAVAKLGKENDSGRLLNDARETVGRWVYIVDEEGG